jgi:hypothetical protein
MPSLSSASAQGKAVDAQRVEGLKLWPHSQAMQHAQPFRREKFATNFLTWKRALLDEDHG